MTDVFISYAPEAEPSALALSAKLESAGLTTWGMFKSSAPAAQSSWSGEMRKARVIVTIESPGCFEDQYCKTLCTYGGIRKNLLAVGTPELKLDDVPAIRRAIEDMLATVARLEREAWEVVAANRDVGQLRIFAMNYPNGQYAVQAEALIGEIEKKKRRELREQQARERMQERKRREADKPSSRPAQSADDAGPRPITRMSAEGPPSSMDVSPDLKRPPETQPSSRDGSPVLGVSDLCRLRAAAGPSVTTLDAHAWSENSDVVDCSVFAPTTARPREPFLIQVFLHLPEQAAIAAALAIFTDASAQARPSQTLLAEIRRGASIEVELDGRGLEIDTPRVVLKWRGKPTVAQFSATFPSDTVPRNSFHPIVRLMVDGVPIGRVVFIVNKQATIGADRLGSVRHPSGSLQLQGYRARRYTKAFLSYSSQDRHAVLQRAQMLQAANIAFFQDILTLKPGDPFERHIEGWIDEADLFILFWSRNARQSEWVQKELARALRRQKSDPEGLPDIAPVILGSLKEAPPPSAISHLHMNDTISYLVAAERPSVLRKLWNGLLGR